jgi:ribose-phosphate pyrophosphokinase
MIKVNGEIVKINRFPDNTERLELSKLLIRELIQIDWHYDQGEEMSLYFITRHIQECKTHKKLVLNMPYVPHARMDRVEGHFNVFTLKYFCDFINSLHFDKVIIKDPHSNVVAALLNNVFIPKLGSTLNAVAKKVFSSRNDILFFPDEGACKRYAGMVDHPYAFGIKKRDWSTGKIIGLDVHGTIPEKPFNVLIIDDICSYGGTFLHAARKLKELGADKIYLYVTHCENSILKGELISSGLLENIYTTDSIFTEKHDLIKVLGEVLI